ncbi:MAG: hypothetical protein WC959_08495 [Kiritimatiellales bacterium]
MNFKTSSLTLVIQNKTVDAVWIEQSLLGPAVKMAERFPRAEAPELLAEKICTAGKIPARVLVCPPRSLVMQCTLFYPAAVRNDLAQMLQFEAARHVPLPENDRRISFAFAPAPDGKQIGVNLLAARASEITALLAPFRAAGIPVDEVIPLSALLVSPPESASQLIIFSSGGETELALYANGLLQDSLNFEYRIRNVEQQREGDTSKFEIPCSTCCGSELVDSIRKLVARHRDLIGAEGVGKIIYTGDEKLPEETRHALEAAFGLYVQTLEAPENFPAGNPALTPALCAAVAEAPATLNLIDRSGRKVPLSRRTLIIIGLAALLAVELTGGWLVHTFAPAAAIKSVERETAVLRRRAAPVAAVRNENREMQAEIAQLNELVQTRESVMEMLNTISTTLPTNTYLQGMDYSRGKSIQLRGRSKEPDQLPQLVMSLPFAGAVEESNIGEKNEDYYGFRITAALRSSGDE